MLSFPQQQKIVNQILKRASNSQCADCSCISPTWASLDFGVFLCSNCSGAHRALGPTVTRVKSTKLDLWDPEWFNNMQVGNKQLNQFWEHKVTALTKKPKLGASLEQVNRYVTDKYIKKKYVGEGFDPLTLYKQAKQGKGKPTINVHTPTLGHIKSEQPKKQMQFKNILQSSSANKKQQSSVKGDLLDFIEDLPAKPKSDGNPPIQQEDQFGSFTDAATENSQRNPQDMTFQQLMNLQRSKSNPVQQSGQYNNNNNQFPNIHHFHHNYVNTMEHQNNYGMMNPHTLASNYPMHSNNYMNMNAHQGTHNRGMYHSMSHNQGIQPQIDQINISQSPWPTHHHHYHHQNTMGINGHLPVNASFPGDFTPITLSTIQHQTQTKIQESSWASTWK